VKNSDILIFITYLFVFKFQQDNQMDFVEKNPNPSFYFPIILKGTGNFYF